MKLQEALDYIDFNEIRSPWIMRISNKGQLIFVKKNLTVMMIYLLKVIVVFINVNLKY